MTVSGGFPSSVTHTAKTQATPPESNQTTTTSSPQCEIHRVCPVDIPSALWLIDATIRPVLRSHDTEKVDGDRRFRFSVPGSRSPLPAPNSLERKKILERERGGGGGGNSTTPWRKKANFHGKPCRSWLVGSSASRFSFSPPQHGGTKHRHGPDTRVNQLTTEDFWAKV